MGKKTRPKKGKSKMVRRPVAQKGQKSGPVMIDSDFDPTLRDKRKGLR